MSKTILYARVSTSEQTLEHQLIHAEAAGFKIDEVIEDHGVSGITQSLADREGGRRLLNPMVLREGDTLVVRWVDRLGRNYREVTDTIRYLKRRGVIIRTVIHDLTFGGAEKGSMEEALQDAHIGFMAAMAQAQAEATKEAQKAGIANAKNEERYLGRKPSYTRRQFEIVKSMLAQDAGATAISKATDPTAQELQKNGKAKRLTRQTVLRIKTDPVRAEEILDRWGVVD